jgi:hypothetical protein
MNRPRWADLARAVVGRLLIYGGAIPMAVFILCPELPTVWSLWRAGALDDAPPFASAPVTQAAPAPLEVVLPVAPTQGASREKERRFAALSLIATLDQCRRAERVLRSICGETYAAGARPAFIEPTCRKLPDHTSAADRAESAFRLAFSAKDVADALDLSRENFERQFAGPLQHRFSGFDIETLDRVVHDQQCVMVMDPATASRAQAGFAESVFPRSESQH